MGGLCGVMGKVVRGGQEDRGLSLLSCSKRERESQTNEVKGIEFKQFSLGRREGDPQSTTPPWPLLLHSFISLSISSPLLFSPLPSS